MISQNTILSNSRLAQLVERVTSNDEVSRSSRLMGKFYGLMQDILSIFFSSQSYGTQKFGFCLATWSFQSSILYVYYPGLG